MRRVLLYESGTSGHRPVILRYLVEGLREVGWEPVVFSDPQYSLLRSSDLKSIEAEADRQCCEVIHLLTIDGCARRWLSPRAWGEKRRVPIVATYYLFSNLWGLKGLAWVLAYWFGYYDIILVSDPSLDRRCLIPSLRRKIKFTPDPWRETEFPFISQHEARIRLNLPEDKRLILVFGAISQHKGITRILSALRLVKSTDFCVLLAGRISLDARDDIGLALADPFLSQRLIVRDCYIPEEEVSCYFYACDASVSDYPKQFKVSSGVFTRVLAARRIPIVPSHGVNAEVVRRMKYGYLYRSESISDLAAAIDNFLTQKGSFDHHAVDRESRAREHGQFIRSTGAVYNSLVYDK